MKQKRTLKKLLCMLVTAAMLFAVIAVQVSAEGEVTISSDYYEIDNENHVISKVLYNTFVGDFMKRIDAGDNVKILKNGDDEVFQGFVTNEMTFYAGNTAYSIEYYSLYSLKDKMDAYIAEQGDEFTSQVMLNYQQSAGTFVSAVTSSDLKTAGFFDAGLVGGGSEASGDYMTATLYKNAGSPYLELSTNRKQLLYLVTEVLDDYSTDNKYVGKYVVSELDVDSIDYDATTNTFNSTAESDKKRSGLLAAGHYYLATDKNIAPTNRDILSDAYKGDMIFFGDKGKLGLIGSYKSTYVKREMTYLSDPDAFTRDEPYNVKEYNTIFTPGSGADLGNINIAKLYFSKNVNGVFTEEAVASNMNVPLNNTLTNLNRISKGMLGVAVNRCITGTGTLTTAKIKDYRLYLAENFHDAVNTDNGISGVLFGGFDSTNTSSEQTDETTGFAINWKPATLKNVIPGTTVKELIDTVNPTKQSYIKITKDDVQLSDNDLITTGAKMTVYAPTVSARYSSRPYTITLASYGDATYNEENGTYTVTIEANNTVGVTFMAAAYDSSNKIIAAKVFGNGSDTVLFACDNPETIRVFAFKNLETIKPVAASKLATEAVPEP